MEENQWEVFLLMSWKDIWRPLLENLEQGSLPQKMDLGKVCPEETTGSREERSKYTPDLPGPCHGEGNTLSIALREFFWLV